MSVSSPYRGLAPFEDTELDALYFFGRERDTEIVVANLIASRLTILYGPSGVGKSSLLFATVARGLRALPEAPLVVVFSSWGGEPTEELAAAVAELAGIEAAGLVDTLERAQAGRDVYLILDQAEEYFTYHESPGRFEAALAAIVNGPLRVNVLLSLREDTLATLDRLKSDVPQLFANVLRLDRLDRASGRAAIVGPLRRWNELEGGEIAAEEALPLATSVWVAFARLDPRQPGSDAVRWLPLIFALDWAPSHPDEPPTRPGPQLLEEFIGRVACRRGRAQGAGGEEAGREDEPEAQV